MTSSEPDLPDVDDAESADDLDDADPDLDAESDELDTVLVTPRLAPVTELSAATVATRTRETLALLRRLRRAHLREHAGSAAFAAYAAAIGLLVYGGALLPWLRRLSTGHQHTTDADQLAAAAPPALIALVLLLLLAVLRDALWRGPVTLALPAASWLLPMPIDRGKLLRPRLRNQLVVGVAAGAVFGAAVAIALTTGGLAPGHFGALLGAGAASFAVTGLLAVALATLVERYPRAARLVRLLAPFAVLAALGLATQSAFAWYGHDVPVLTTVETWSGPWGWATQPVLDVATPTVATWPAALAVLAVLAVAVTVVAVRICPGLPGRTLRVRAKSVAGFTTGLTTLNPRAAALEVREARGRPARNLRLPRPHSTALIIPWRDATALIRTPSRLAWAVLLTAIGFLLIGLSVGVANLYLSLAELAGGLVAGYLAVTQLTEPARLDADDPRRAGSLPYAFDKLALRHAVVPLVVAGVLAEIGAAVAVGITGSLTPLLVPIISVPALVGAALVSAYRGPVPGAAMVGPETPAGNMGMITVVGWYVAGPLVGIVLLLPPMHLVVGATAVGSTLNYVLWGLAVAAILVWWSVRRARARAADIHP